MSPLLRNAERETLRSSQRFAGSLRSAGAAAFFKSFALTQVAMGVASKFPGEIDVRVLALANAMTEGG